MKMAKGNNCIVFIIFLIAESSNASTELAQIPQNVEIKHSATADLQTMLISNIRYQIDTDLQNGTAHMQIGFPSRVWALLQIGTICNFVVLCDILKILMWSVEVCILL